MPNEKENHSFFNNLVYSKRSVRAERERQADSLDIHRRSGKHGQMAYSSDGEEWIAVQNSRFGNHTINDITYGGGYFVAVGNSGKMAYSADGITWTEVPDSTFGTSNINAIAFGNGKFVAVGNDRKTAYSSGN